jgi:hypothetical protein
MFVDCRSIKANPSRVISDRFDIIWVGQKWQDNGSAVHKGIQLGRSLRSPAL